MAEIGLSKNEIIAQLVRSAHGKLLEYVPLGKRATEEYPDFMAHLIAWDKTKGQIRDAKVALPIVTLMVPGLHEEFVDNALAHITLLGPREMLAGYRFALGTRVPGHMTAIRKVLCAKLTQNEKNWPKWERTMLQHRNTLRELFSLLHLKTPDSRTDACLFRRTGKTRLPYPEGGLFETVAKLKGMSPQEAAGTILQKKIPFLIAAGAMGDRMKDVDVLLALIKSMSATELVTNTKNLEKWGMKTNAALRGAFQEALSKAGDSTANLLKTTTAAEAIEDDELKESLRGLQEKQIAKASGVEGDWLVLADKSGSMKRAIEMGREIAATLAKMVKGKVWLVFFDTTPQTVEVTGLALDAIQEKTKHVRADGGTSIGCGLVRMLENHIVVDGVAIVSDGGDNTHPEFHDAYKIYSEEVGKQVPVYFYQVRGTDPPVIIQNMKRARFDLQVFDLMEATPDRYSLPNLVKTMRTNRYSLIDEIMDTALLKLPDALKHAKSERASA